MPRKISSRKLNVVNAIIYSEIGLTRSPYRQSLRILHSLVKNKSTKFEKIWCEKSNQPIIYEDGKIYFNNHTTCMALCGKDSLPSNIYRLQKNTKVKRFEDVFIYSGPVYCTPLPREDFKPYFLALTSDNWLIRYDNLNGKVLQEIYLGSVQRYSFRHVDWETQGETIVLQSTLFPGVSNRTPNAKKLKVVQAVAIFTIMPIKFIGLFEIDQAQFGKEVNTANISEGLLILGIGSSTNGKIRIYSLKEVLKESNRLYEATLDTKCDDIGGKVGQYPFGLPLNYQIKALPPILFEVKCGEQNLHFGGYPWHYVINPPNTTGVFEVRNVQTNKLAECGRFDLPNNTTEVDTLTFHSDDSGRLVYESGNSIRFFKFTVESNGNCLKTALKQQYELKLLLNDEMTNGNGLALTNGTTFSREATKNVSYVDKPERSILAEDFENELEFYLLLGIDTQTNKKKNGRILIFDNECGQLLHEIKLGINLDEMLDYSLIMDLDTLIITSKQVGGNKFECHIFRMSRDSDIDLQRSETTEVSDDKNETTLRKKRRKRHRKFY